MMFETASSALIQALYTRIRTSDLTQLAAAAFGFLVGFLFMQIEQGDAPSLGTFGTAVLGLGGAVMALAMDALTTARTKRRHAAWYLLGVVAGALVMFVLITAHVTAPLVPRPSPSPSPAA